jgi:hypothetical protein
MPTMNMDNAKNVRPHEPIRWKPTCAASPPSAIAGKSTRYHALVAMNTGTQTHEELHHRHGSVLGTLMPLIERGQAAGDFRTDVAPAWHLAMLMALVHAGSLQRQARRLPAADAEASLVATVLGAVSASPRV